MDHMLGQKMSFFCELLTCGQDISCWEFDPAMQLVNTNRESPEVLCSFLTQDDCTEKLQACVASGMSKPLLLSNSDGFSWIASFEKSGELISRIYLIGPVFTSDVSRQTLMNTVKQGRYPDEISHQLSSRIENIPIVPLITWMHYGLMLHFCVTGEKLETSDFSYPVEPLKAADRPISKAAAAKNGTWLAEQNAMKMIETGCLDYQKSFGRLSMAASYVLPTNVSQPSREIKNSMISFVTLATRAAIRGGLNPEMAYYIGAQYIEHLETCSTVAELVQLNLTMYDDFVKRVHKVRTANGISPSVQACCNYIDLHLAEKITASQLAQAAGYSEYYISAKFKKEMGMNISAYIRERRVEQAQFLLRSTNQSIQEIGESLGFCNSSHFALAFREVTGMSPVEYRETGGR